jgi:hypothetical protein
LGANIRRTDKRVRRATGNSETHWISLHRSTYQLKMVEFHIDTSEKVLSLVNMGEFERNLSVLFPVGSKALIAFGAW